MQTASIVATALAALISLGALAAVPVHGSSLATPVTGVDPDRQPPDPATASVIGGAGAPSADPAPAQAPVSEALYWRVDTLPIRGLIVVSRAAPDDDLVISFHLWGLRPRTSYLLFGSPNRCAGPAGSPIFERGFRTDRQGVFWDPVRTPGSLEEIRSVRLRLSGSSRSVHCANSGTVATMKVDNDSMKCDVIRPHRCLVAIDESDGRRTIVSLTGLRAGVRHAVVLRSGGCLDGGDVIARHAFRSDAAGRAIIDRTEPGDGGNPPAPVASLVLKRGVRTLDCLGLAGAPTG